MEDFKRQLKMVPNGKLHHSIRLYRQDGREYKKLHKYDVLDGYANVAKNGYALFGPCVIQNPYTNYKYVWINLWRGECGKIVKCSLFDLQEQAIVQFDGTACFKYYWNFRPDIPFNEDAAITAYDIFSQDKVHREINTPVDEIAALAAGGVTVVAEGDPSTNTQVAQTGEGATSVKENGSRPKRNAKLKGVYEPDPPQQNISTKKR